MMNRAYPIGIIVAASIACGPPGLGGETNGEDSTTEQGTSVGTESSESSDPPSESSDFVPGKEDLGPIDCDPYAQDCPIGEKCVPYGSTGGNWDDHKCVAVLGDQAPGEPCTYGGVVEATDDCDETSACWDVHDVDGQPIGTCRSFCLGSENSPECPDGSLCLHYLVNLCIPTCDPLVQDCGVGLACFWDGSQFNCIFTTEDLPAGQPCGFINDCAAGLGCLPAAVLPSCEGSACCSDFCDLNLGDGPCEASLPGTVCSPFFEQGMAPPGYDDVGVCIVPP
jgi:hypothetical protein